MENPGLTATLKAGKEFDAPWIVLHAANPDQLNQQLDALDQALLQKVTTTAQLLIKTNEFAVKGMLEPAAPQPTVETPPYQAPAAPAQQAQAVPAQATGPRGEQPHPTATCELCSKPLYAKKTSGGKDKWQCLDWRWNGGTQNGHTMKWPNELS